MLESLPSGRRNNDAPERASNGNNGDFLSLLGAARAAQASRDATVAQSFYAQLGTDRSELAEVKTLLAQE